MEHPRMALDIEKHGKNKKLFLKAMHELTQSAMGCEPKHARASDGFGRRT